MRLSSFLQRRCCVFYDFFWNRYPSFEHVGSKSHVAAKWCWTHFKHRRLPFHTVNLERHITFTKYANASPTGGSSKSGGLPGIVLERISVCNVAFLNEAIPKYVGCCRLQILSAILLLTTFSGIHHAYTVCDIGHHTEGMRDKDNCHLNCCCSSF